MLHIHRETTDAGALILKLEGEATIEYAGQLHQALLEGLREADHLLIDTEQVTAFDFYIIQMLCSAHRSSVAWLKCLTFTGIPAPVVEAAIRQAGFARKHGCNLCPEGVDCMWLNQTCLTIH